MRQSLHSRVVAALTAPLLALAVIGPGLVLCEQQKHACCQPKQHDAPAVSMQLQTGDCCAKLAVPSVPAATHELSAPVAPLVTLAPGHADEPVLVASRLGDAPRLEPPRVTSILLSHCSLLI